jgi:CheY-like chemotaxis protein
MFLHKPLTSSPNAQQESVSLLDFLALKNNLNILLADDDADDRELFEEAITELNSKIKLLTLEDGIQLMNALNNEENIPDIVFLDMNMPLKSGKKCLEEIRNNPKYNSLFIIIYSTSSNPKDVEDAYNMDANLYIRKPNSYTELIEILKVVFSLNIQEYHPKALKINFVLNPGRYKLLIND